MKTKVFTDGGARGNPGPAAIGYVIYKKEEKIAEHYEYIGETTNNVAEYTAVIRALEFLAKLTENNNVEIYIDSLLIQKQMCGEYKIKNNNMKSLSNIVKELEKQFNAVKYIHIPREKNKEADALVNKALNRQLLSK